MGRRLLVVALLVSCCSGVAAAATADPLEPQEYWLARAGAPPATPPGPGVPLTIIDSGTDSTHPEFAGRPNTTYLNDQTVSGPEEFHGTAVASVAAAPRNGKGIVGVYPEAALQVFDASPVPGTISRFSAIVGIRNVAEHCPTVINLSFSSVTPDPALYDAILTAIHNGCFVVASAGNSGDQGSPVGYPASWPHVFTVGASDENDTATSFSTSSQGVDAAAPGVSIIGAVPLSRAPEGYGTFAGTSFSAPIVAAAAAWIWTVRPTLTAGELGDVLRSTARDIGPPGFDPASGWGIIDIPAALAAPVPITDAAEPNDDVAQVVPGRLFADGEAPLTTQAKTSTRIAATLDVSEDPRDVYRIWVPAGKTVRAGVSAGGVAAARIWGPRTVSTGEGLQSRRRDLRGPSIRAGKKGFEAYVEVLLTGRSADARYVLSVTAARR